MAPPPWGREWGIQRKEPTIKRPTIALAAALAASPLAAQDYPRGLFENSPVVPSGPPGGETPYGPGAEESQDDYCAGVEYRTFRSLAEVRRARARCERQPRKPGQARDDERDQ